MSGLAVVTDVPVLMVTLHGLFHIQPLAIRLSSFFLDSMFSVKQGDEGDDAGIPTSRWLVLISEVLVDIFMNSLLM
jgi:hypothetical protein